MRPLKLLITSGATREPIDGVRFISNFSTGKTGAALADVFSETGFDVTYLRGEGAAEPSSSRCQIRGFGDFVDLDESLKRELGGGNYSAVIHLAAVSDYSVREVKVGGRSFSPRELRKLDSHESGDELALVLGRNFKIVDRLKSYAGAGSGLLVVAFKLTNSADREGALRATERLAASRTPDAVVYNDLAQMRDGSGVHRFEFFRTTDGRLGTSTDCAGTAELGVAMIEWFRESLTGGNA